MHFNEMEEYYIYIVNKKEMQKRMISCNVLDIY